MSEPQDHLPVAAQGSRNQFVLSPQDWAGGASDVGRRHRRNQDAMAVAAGSDDFGQQLGVVVVGEGRPYSAREVAGALGVSLTGSVEWAPSSAAVFSEGADYPPAGRLGRLAGRKATKESFARGPYLRSVATVGDVLRRRAAAVVVPDPLTSAEESAR